MGRLAREREAEGNTIVYAYDRFSNRSSTTVTGSETYTTTYGYHPNNWLLTEEKREKDTVETYRYRYDGNGNQVYREWSRTGPDDGTPPRVGYVPNGFRRELATLEIRGYNGFNQMASLYADGERTAYTYRPDGLRYGKTYGSGAGATGVTHLWDGQNIVAEAGALGNITARYLRGANLICRVQGGAAQYYLFNAHGDVAQRTDALGNLLKNYRYDAFGNEENPEPLDVNPFRYCGEYFDRETGDYYLRARSYDPRTGRFTAEDSTRSSDVSLPGDKKTIDPLSLNLYIYCRGDSINFIDPSGNRSKWIDLGKGWKVRIDPPHTDKGLKHVHLEYKDGKKKFSQNDDGSPHDKNKKSPGDPPTKVLERLREETDWDWQANQQDWADKITIETDEKGWTFVFPDGKRVREYYATGEIMAMPTSEMLAGYYVMEGDYIELNQPQTTGPNSTVLFPFFGANFNFDFSFSWTPFSGPIPVFG